MAGTGSRGSYNSETQPRYTKEAIVPIKGWYELSDTATFLSILKTKGKTVKEKNQKFSWSNAKPRNSRFKVAAADAVATTLTFDATSTTDIFFAGDIVINSRTNEQMVVNSKTATTIDVSRGVGSTAAPILATDVMAFLSAAHIEGSLAPEGSLIYYGDDFNYSQVYRKDVDMTRNQESNESYIDTNDIVKQCEKVLKDHTKEIEQQLIWGQRYKDMTNPKPKYISGGLCSYIKTNHMVLNTDFHINHLSDMMAQITKNSDVGMEDKILFCGTDFLSQFSQNQVQVLGGAAGAWFDSVKIKSKELVTNFGSLSIVSCPALNIVNSWRGIIVSMSQIELHEIQPTKLSLNIETPGYDGKKNGYLTDCGLAVHNENMHGIIDMQPKVI